uniref:rRNA N-glycosylase n=1 Tax=Zea mays subsp. parviglumis TaxID=76912 RepID=B8QXI5_ZEAMP|nr:ribosome-inactivating protein [Zea mays subsp. parviglumis]
MAETTPELSDLMAQTNKKIVPKFTEIFPVEDANYPYSAFIASVRKDVIKHCTDHKGIFQPVLPPEKKVPELWFYTELKTRTSSITLAIRMDNLYLVGFRTPGGVWWEFGKDGDTHLLGDNPRWLGFGGRYQDLIGNKGLETVTMGRAEMTRAVNDLAKKKKMATLEEEDVQMQMPEAADLAAAAAAADPQADTKSKLVKLVVMVCEGLRFNTVSRTVDAGFNSQHGVTLSVTQGKQVQKWDRISKAAFEWADHPTAVIPDMQKLGIKDKNEAARIVALVKNQTTAAAATVASADNDDDEA